MVFSPIYSICPKYWYCWKNEVDGLHELLELLVTSLSLPSPSFVGPIFSFPCAISKTKDKSLTVITIKKQAINVLVFIHLIRTVLLVVLGRRRVGIKLCAHKSANGQ